MQPRTWGFLWQEAFAGISRNGFMSVAAVTTVAICLTALAAILLVAVNLQFMADTAESQVEMAAYMREDFDRRAGPAMVDEIESIPGVRAARLVTREEGLERLRVQFGDQAFLLDGYEDPELNPLRDALEISLADPRAAREVAARLDSMGSVEEVSHRQDIVDQLLGLTRILRLMGMALVVLLGVATVFIVSNTVRLTVFARREQISIMKLVGATDGFIRWPFFLEGLLLGLIGGSGAAALAWYGYSYIIGGLVQAVPFLPILAPQPLLWNLAKMLAGLGAGIGAVGSSISVRRFLPA